MKYHADGDIVDDLEDENEDEEDLEELDLNLDDLEEEEA